MSRGLGGVLACLHTGPVLGHLHWAWQPLQERAVEAVSSSCLGCGLSAHGPAPS